jgi:hypothetical protein
MTENQMKPCASAHCAFAFVASNASAAPALSIQDKWWMPDFSDRILQTLSPIISF